jgi:hypothetical protein
MNRSIWYFNRTLKYCPFDRFNVLSLADCQHATMKLSTIRDLLIVIGIYLYFIAWVYLHKYYGSFGISTESLKLDYSTYLVFSYNVLVSEAFLWYAGSCIVLYFIIAFFTAKILRQASMKRKRKMVHCRNVFVVVLLIALFPILYVFSRNSALRDYNINRAEKGNRHIIEFVFRETAGFSVDKDSTSYHSKIIRNNQGRGLRLLGETDEYYIVLNQLKLQPKETSLAEGSVYYISKKDVLYTRIVLP